MRPPTGARPVARDTSNSVGPRCSSRRRRARQARSSGAQTNTHSRRRPPQAWACASRRELRSMGNSGAGWYERRRGRPPLRRSGVASSRRSVFPRGGSAQVARALCRALSTIGWGCRSPSPRSGAPASRVMRRASSRGSTSISPRELRREPGAQADSSARDALGASRRRKGRTLEMRPWTSASQPHAHGRAARGSGAARATGRVA
jgi:hypothetical protein